MEQHVIVIDRRNHTGGNCYSSLDDKTEIECHRYGSHIFHTSNKDVWGYINRFTTFNSYQHKVWSTHNNRVYSMPINLHTINSFYGEKFTPDAARRFIQEEAAKEGITAPRNMEEKAVSLIGRPLYEAFFKGYTIKQWDKNPSELSAEIITRLPVRYSYNNRYFADTYEGIPTDGYGALFKKMLGSPLIDVQLNTDFRDIRHNLPDDALIIYTGPIDQYFDYQLGKLEWRTVDFEISRPCVTDFQGTSVMNYADADVPYTRIHEFKHFHPERPDTGKTIIFKEYSRAAQGDDEPYYPVNTERNRKLYAAYRELAASEPNVIFGGRLGQYQYLDMDDTIAEALQCYETQVKPRLIQR